MSEIPFLKWLTTKTQTKWWHDSAIPDEIQNGVDNGATGITTNPFLVATSLAAIPEYWKPYLQGVLEGAGKAEEAVRRVTQKAASMVLPAFEASQGKQGYACAQVNPRYPGDAELMLEMAKRLTTWAPNIAVKLPVTAAGLEVLEECAALGITVTATVSFTVPQVLAIAERYQMGIERARKAGTPVSPCFAVVMVGRIDDYIRDVAHDSRANVAEEDVIQCGTAVMKRAYEIYKQKGYEAVLMPAGMRGAYHAADLAGAEITMSIHPKIQKMIEKLAPPFEERIDIPVEQRAIDRLMKIPEFVRAYEPDGMKITDFITYGVVQKTLAQFVEAGWAPIEALKLKNHQGGRFNGDKEAKIFLWGRVACLANAKVHGYLRPQHGRSHRADSLLHAR